MHIRYILATYSYLNAFTIGLKIIHEKYFYDMSLSCGDFDILYPHDLHIHRIHCMRVLRPYMYMFSLHMWYTCRILASGFTSSSDSFGRIIFSPEILEIHGPWCRWHLRMASLTTTLSVGTLF